MSAYVGIDVAKDTLVVALLGPATPRRRSFANTASGHADLCIWLAKQHISVSAVCLEATGTYGDEVALALHQAGYAVSIVNPARIAAYAQSRLSRSKTDPVDALLIARFAASEQVPLWTPPEPAVRELRALVRYLDALLMQRQAELNRHAAALHPEPVAHALAAHITFLDEQVAALRDQIDKHIDQHPQLKAEHDLLVSIVGIGTRTATRLLAETGGLRQYRDGRAVSAYAGLTPRQYTSGTSVHRRSRLSKVGNAALRAALFFPAIVAKQHNPVIAAFCQRLKERGLAPRAVIGAAMRKLLELAYGVVKSGQPFDPAYAQVASVPSA